MQAMQTIGHPTPPSTTEFFTIEGQTVPDWYRQLVYTARAFQASDTLPLLSLSPRPFVDYRKEIIEYICQIMDLDLSEWPTRQEED
jgi:hypothetical protein